MPHDEPSRERRSDAPDRAPPAGLTARTATWDDLHAVAGLFTGAGTTGAPRPVLRAEDLRVRWLLLDGLDDVLLVSPTGSEPVVVGYLDRQEDPAPWEGEPVLHAELQVHPAWTGRGIGSYLLGVASRQARALARSSDHGSARLRTTVRGDDQRSRRFLEARGFSPVRHLLSMRLDLHAAPPSPAWPPGVRCRAFEPGRDEERAWRGHQAAFADVPTHLPVDLDDWLEDRIRRDPAPDPGLLLLAEHDGEVVGIAVCRAGAHGAPEDGWVRDLGVLPAWRHRGIGMALLRTAFAAFRRRGLTGAALEVDDVTLEGAVSLYRRAGMRVTARTDVYERHVGTSG